MRACVQRYPTVWQGLLVLKNDAALVQFQFVGGNNVLAHRSLPSQDSGPSLRIAQRMRLEASQLESVTKKMMVRLGAGIKWGWSRGMKGVTRGRAKWLA